jgi:hypothetical protein
MVLEALQMSACFLKLRLCQCASGSVYDIIHVIMPSGALWCVGIALNPHQYMTCVHSVAQNSDIYTRF